VYECPICGLVSSGTSSCPTCGSDEETPNEGAANSSPKSTQTNENLDLPFDLEGQAPPVPSSDLPFGLEEVSNEVSAPSLALGLEGIPEATISNPLAYGLEHIPDEAE
jgi:hypothetical protein